MSEYKMKIFLGAALAVIIAVGLAAAAITLAPQLGHATQQTTFTQQQTSQTLGPKSTLIVQLTDPPIVPEGTSSMNLTYSAINLFVTEPSTATASSQTATGDEDNHDQQQQSQVATSTISVIPSGGTATVDLLRLQNVSQTIALANLTDGSMIYSISFTVSSISIDVDGVVSPVTLATSGNSTLLVTLVAPASLHGTNAVLLDLNPTIISTASGYQMIPSSVGIIKPQSELTGDDDHVGSTHPLSNQDHDNFDHAKGNVNASLLSLSTNGNATTVTFQVNNTGTSHLVLVAIGLSGNFSLSGGSACNVSSTENHHHGEDEVSSYGHEGCETPDGIVLVPTNAGVTSTDSSQTTTTTTTASTTATGSACLAETLTVVHSTEGIHDTGPLVIAPGECVTLTFSGTITFGNSAVIVPSVESGQNYTVHVIASDNAELKLECTLPISGAGCSSVTSAVSDSTTSASGSEEHSSHD